MASQIIGSYIRVTFKISYKLWIYHCLNRSWTDSNKNHTSGGQKTDYTKIFWRPTVGKQQVRIVPSAYNSKNPFKELKFYYGITNKVMISPLNFGEKDPIYLFAQKLREEYNKENYILAKKLDAKTRIFRSCSC